MLPKHPEESSATLSSELVELVLWASISLLGRLWIEEKAARRVVSNLAGKRRVYAVGNRRVLRFRASRRLVARVN